MRARVFIRKTTKGYFLEIDNGYGNNLMLTDILPSIEDVLKELELFKLIVESPDIE